MASTTDLKPHLPFNHIPLLLVQLDHVCQLWTLEQFLHEGSHVFLRALGLAFDLVPDLLSFLSYVDCKLSQYCQHTLPFGVLRTQPVILRKLACSWVKALGWWLVLFCFVFFLQFITESLRSYRGME